MGFFVLLYINKYFVQFFDIVSANFSFNYFIVQNLYNTLCTILEFPIPHKLMQLIIGNR